MNDSDKERCSWPFHAATMNIKKSPDNMARELMAPQKMAPEKMALEKMVLE